MGFIDFFKRIDRRSRIMNDMSNKVGVAWQDTVGDNGSNAGLYREAVMRCCACEHEGDCLRWMDQHESAEHAPSFCRNRDCLDGLHQH